MAQEWNYSNSVYDRILDGPSLYYKAYIIVSKLQDILPEYVTENLVGELIDVVFGFPGWWNRFSHTTGPDRLDFTGLSPGTHGL